MVEYLAVLTFSVLFVSVPLQFFLSPQSSGELKYYLTQFVDNFRTSGLLSHVFSAHQPHQTTDDALAQDEYNNLLSNALQQQGIALALADDHFATSTEPRDPKPPFVKYSVGQVFRHAKSNYRAVIVGWDEKAKAPDYWFKEQGGPREWNEQPNYLALIDTRDRHVAQVGYVAEENINPVEGVSIVHPFIQKYFERFNGVSYVPRPWLRETYPFG